MSMYLQPPKGTKPAPPCTPYVPATSNCKTYKSCGHDHLRRLRQCLVCKEDWHSNASSDSSSSSSSSLSSSSASGSATPTLFVSTGFLTLVVGMFSVLA
ncbi:hypothetical protein JCM8547_007681 [Rhodosporidiobolus lusitaniae]